MYKYVYSYTNNEIYPLVHDIHTSVEKRPMILSSLLIVGTP